MYLCLPESKIYIIYMYKYFVFRSSNYVFAGLYINSEYLLLYVCRIFGDELIFVNRIIYVRMPLRITPVSRTVDRILDRIQFLQIRIIRVRIPFRTYSVLRIAN